MSEKDRQTFWSQNDEDRPRRGLKQDKRFLCIGRRFQKKVASDTRPAELWEIISQVYQEIRLKWGASLVTGVRAYGFAINRAAVMHGPHCQHDEHEQAK